jgi:hypothetical protein
MPWQQVAAVHCRQNNVALASWQLLTGLAGFLTALQHSKALQCNNTYDSSTVGVEVVAK